MKLLRVLLINCRHYWSLKRLLPIFTFSFMYTLIMLSSLKEVAVQHDKVIPWSVWSLLFTHSFYIGVTMTSVLLLFSTLPFENAMQPWLILKVGYRKWGLAQMVYIVCTSLLFTVIHFLMTIVYLIPYGVPLNTWGSLIKNLSMGQYQLKHPLYLSLNSIALDFYSTTRALLQVAIMVFLISCLIGMVVFVFNLIIPRLGLILSGGLIILSFVFGFATGLWIYFLSPLNWINPYQIRHAPYSGLPTFLQVVSWTIGLLALLVIIGYQVLRRKELYHK
ncbi:hypothetical protein I4Q36_02760 [Tuanshanicoccus lijuaniae]|uniref:hypothetical protein n=1 Tax=Aerococcaceae bacterium zg-1292 TaxID=2774330 RepID=UPI001938D624|nr:hypothetical protein [Aerococcaceae bacterium zg-1292]MBF6626190.1 hypothetical protein [Aerococcaceae bacterium zg-BR9]MBF6978051.1 hypothetical protein [Aerococcaceae bacterium zg-BR22]MBS4456076.1 hypothetical protein [Aerococcaceae bacterium zg-A91]MBS4457828.1 hypothetical protein [Aerococcaceae bacterium zg-BR33]